jgi:RNA polymerase sigma factor (sigma-70 family)
VNDQSDSQLLRAYAEHRAEPAFAELVRRHVDFVYSAAKRMVCDSHLAEDVTQGVFVALAKQARQLADHPVLSGWLHGTTQNIAAQTVRTDVRRRAREQEVVAMNELIVGEPEAGWEHIAPYLDAALGELNESDRDALLLRYFERKSAQEMAQTLGISDEAAQKRVSRAVEKLREFFSKRNVTIGAGGLAVVISVNAVQAAPMGLAATISAAVALTGTAVSASTLITTTKVIAMTTLQKSIIGAAFAVAVGTGIFEAHQNSKLQNQNEMLQQQQASLADQIQQLRHERDDATNQLAGLLAENARLKSNSSESELLKLRGEIGQLMEANRELSSATNDARNSLVKSWLEREDKLKQLVSQFPDKSIPEFQLLSEQEWLDAAMNAKFDSDKDIQQDLANLRHTAENDLATQMHNALSQYMSANNGQFPTDLSQLQPYFKTPIDEAILNRWEILPQSALPNQSMGGDWVITEKSPVDQNLDTRWAIGQSGYGNTSYPQAGFEDAAATLQPAMKAYAAANNGRQPIDPSQLQPYLTTPEQQAAFQKLMGFKNAALQSMNASPQ